jgi:hypothetical protein
LHTLPDIAGPDPGLHAMRSSTDSKRCDRCGGVRTKREYRYCLKCYPVVQREMEESGYRQPLPKRTPERPLAARERIVETKLGIDF